MFEHHRVWYSSELLNWLATELPRKLGRLDGDQILHLIYMDGKQEISVFPRQSDSAPFRTLSALPSTVDHLHAFCYA